MRSRISPTKSVSRSPGPAQRTSPKRPVTSSGINPEQMAHSKYWSKEMEYILLCIRDSSEKLKEALELYTTLSRNRMPQRCLAHNNNISLYCVNEHKLLCVNCVYSDTTQKDLHKHRTHKVIPSVEAMNDIKKDNTNMSFSLAQCLNTLDDKQRCARENVELLESAQASLIDRLEKDFDDIMRIMSNKYLELKTEIMGYFNETNTQNKVIMKNVKNLKEMIVKQVGSFDGIRKSEPGHVSLPEEEIHKHQAYSRLVELSSLLGNIPRKKVDVGNIETQSIKEMGKLKEYVLKHKWIRI